MRILASFVTSLMIDYNCDRDYDYSDTDVAAADTFLHIVCRRWTQITPRTSRWCWASCFRWCPARVLSWFSRQLRSTANYHCLLPSSSSRYNFYNSLVTEAEQQHTDVSSSYRSNRLGLSHWDPYAIVTWWSGPGGNQALSERPTGFLQCFDTVGLVIWPAKNRPRYDL